MEYFNFSLSSGLRNDAYTGANITTPEGFIWTAPVLQRVITIAIIMFITLVGNGTIIAVLTQKRRFSRVNIFILNLAIGDLCVCVVTMTTEILFVAFDQWVLGAVLCKLIVYGQIVTLASATFILTAMSIDRYMAITNPLQMSTKHRTLAHRMVAVAWVAAFMLAIPQLLIFVQREVQRENGHTAYACQSKGYTAEWQRKVYVTWLAFYVMVAPGVIITYCYIRIVLTLGREGSGKADIQSALRRSDNEKIMKAKVKTIRMTLCIVIGFLTTWTPYFVVTLYDVYAGQGLPEVAYVVAETMALFNSALNPIIYGFFSLNFSEIFYKICCACWHRPEDSYRNRKGFIQTFRTEVPDHGTYKMKSVRRRPTIPNANGEVAGEHIFE
ncbi:vasopressin V2 receptor-like [Branchiostoma floridae]|uniref:Vasopressin V2 receptor-like n=2 Tax=Branchiostoma floridae TaxID=7739 RepID=A0A9J7L8G1_BRAFL|nr:vasopressin V2 receptor-like [Branchiostoma floridae]